ncbi:hypothetical protein MTO96_029517 [Rhipicephalus appendiculatus]
MCETPPYAAALCLIWGADQNGVLGVVQLDRVHYCLLRYVEGFADAVRDLRCTPRSEIETILWTNDFVVVVRQTRRRRRAFPRLATSVPKCWAFRCDAWRVKVCLHWYGIASLTLVFFSVLCAWIHPC